MFKFKNTNKSKDWIKVGMSTCGIAAGAEEVFDFLNKEAKNKSIEVDILRCGCAGKCYAEPLLEVKTDKLPIVTYGNVDKKIALKILEEHILNKKLIHDFIYDIRENANEK